MDATALVGYGHGSSPPQTPGMPMARRPAGKRTDARALGRRGEQIAASYLEGHGVRILARNVHLRHAEIDLIGVDGSALCFIEVRLRTSARFGSAAASVDARKQRRIARAAGQWLASCSPPRHESVRFDVVAIDASSDPPHVQHIRGAFSLS
jgi:putative endonuclease